MDGEDVACRARSRPRCGDGLRCRAQADGVGAGSSTADGLEGVVAGDGERAVATLVQGDVGVGNATTSECLGRSRGKADGAGAGDGEVGGGGTSPRTCS